MPKELVGDHWQKVVAKNVAKLRLAAALNQDVIYKPAGCAALANVIEDMAKKLDIAVAMMKQIGVEL